MFALKILSDILVLKANQYDTMKFIISVCAHIS